MLLATPGLLEGHKAPQVLSPRPFQQVFHVGLGARAGVGAVAVVEHGQAGVFGDPVAAQSVECAQAARQGRRASTSSVRVIRCPAPSPPRPRPTGSPARSGGSRPPRD